MAVVEVVLLLLSVLWTSKFFLNWLSCCYSTEPSATYISGPLCRATVYQWYSRLYWPWRPSDQRSHRHLVRSHHPGGAQQNALQHPQLAGQCAEYNRLVSEARGRSDSAVPVLNCVQVHSFLLRLQAILCPWWTWCLCCGKPWKMNPLLPARWLVLR